MFSAFFQKAQKHERASSNLKIKQEFFQKGKKKVDIHVFIIIRQVYIFTGEKIH